MGFNLHFADTHRRPARQRTPRLPRGAGFLAIFALCLAAGLAGDLLLASGCYSSLLIGDTSARVIAGCNALQALVYGR
jgi:hypothetical protein